MEALRFKCYELKYRPSESWLEAINSFLYRWFNNYGLWFSAPLLWLVFLFISFGLVFHFCFFIDCYSSLKITLVNTLVFVRWIMPNSFILSFKFLPDSVVWLSLLQSFFSSILLYLFLIGLRLRFRIRI